MAKAKSNDKSFEADQLELNSRIENFMDQNSNTDHGQFFLTPEPQKNSSKKLLPLDGGVLSGAIGHNPSKIKIISNTIDIGVSSGKYSGFIILESESGTTDNLATIDNFQLSYQEIILQAVSGHTITLTSTDNIDLSNNFPLSNQIAVRLFFDIIANKWKRML